MRDAPTAQDVQQAEQPDKQQAADAAAAPADWLHRVPPDECYWARLDAVHPRSVLAYRFEALLPVDVDSLYLAACRCAEDNDWIVCGVDRAALDAWLAADPQRCDRLWAVCPAALPLFLTDTLSEAELLQLNLLENSAAGLCPRPKQRWQRLSLVLAAVLLLGISFLFFIGAQARVSAAEDYAAYYEQQRQLVLQEQVGTGDAVNASLAALYSQLEQSLRRLRQQQGADSDSSRHDYAALANAVLQQWPPALTTYTDAISFQADRLHIRGHVDDLQSAQDLWQALRRIDVAGSIWQASPLQAQQQQGRVVFQIALQAAADEVRP